MVVNGYIYVFMILIAFKSVAGQDEALIGEHANATYFAKQYVDIQGYLYQALQNNYDTIRIAKGTYFMSRPIQITKSNIAVMGTTDTNETVYTVLQLNNTNVLGLAMFAFIGVSNVSISKLSLDGYNNVSKAAYELNGVAFVNVNNAVLDSVSLKLFRNGVYGNASTNINIAYANVTSSQYDGFLIRDSANIVFVNNSICCNGRHGINIFGSSTNVTVSTTNAFTHNSDSACAVRMEDTTNTTLDTNILADNQVGICMKNLSSVQVIGNVMNRTSDTKCIYMFNVTASQFVNNECNAKLINPLVSPPPPPSLSPPRTTSSPPQSKRMQKSACNMYVMSYALAVVNLMVSLAMVML